MPYNRYGGPEEYYQQGSSNFDPYTGRLQGGNMVLEFLARIAGQKEKKKQEGWDVEDRELKKRLTEAQISNYGETSQPRPTDFEQRLNLYKTDPNAYGEMYGTKGMGESPYPSGIIADLQKYWNIKPEEWDALPFARKKEYHDKYLDVVKKQTDKADKEADDAEKLAFAELRRIGGAGKTERAARQKKHQLLRTQIDTIDKRFLALNKQLSSARYNGDKLLENSTKAEMDRITMQKELLEAEMYNLSADVIGGPAVGVIPPDILAAAKKARPDLSDEEIIRAWQAKKK